MGKIHIIGAVGSGKTTLAKKLSASLSIPMFELDYLVWERHENGDVRRSPEGRNASLDNILKLNQWIIEGAQHRWLEPAFQQADHIIVLNIPY
ncbi:AAA family ATPase [Cytobacillus purgationiresistens]|uniref:Adenylate kinase family enzyme n=1 Tax=Cytobacillus purgationiresistens TaxID=863449 RepID=A0ABU0AEI2_9BACI|nr:AAA family ATPase [Cytobacillus purgationiresistens]MDQ0269656.1 adenylate kinase family enzyme [Cytobacillus purgationiresistens]